MRKYQEIKLLGIGIIIGTCIFCNGCSLDGTSDFTCGAPDDTLFETPPADTAFVKIESVNPEFNKIFRGIRVNENVENPVDDNFSNLSTYERGALGADILFGLGTRITDEADSSGLVIAFNLPVGTEIDDVCRSSKVFKRTLDWSKWNDNIPGVEVILTIPVDGELLTFSSDTSQEDDDILTLTGAEWLDQVGYYAKLEGSFSVKIKQLGSTDNLPLNVSISGNFILPMRVSR